MDISPLKSTQIKEARALINSYPEIFSETDILKYNKDLAFSQENPGTEFLILSLQRELMGIIGYTKDENSHNAYNVDWLIVKQGHEHNGLGHKLITEAEHFIRRKGGRHLYLETSNAKHNQQAKDFYKHLGFIQVGLLPDYFDHPRKNYKKLEDAVLYHKSL